jgi:2-oxoisovalerate ferredoxin oxidoreductase alpha subunit
MVCLEAFILSHTFMPVEIPDQKEIDDFLPPYDPPWLLDVDNPVSHGNIVYPEWYMEFRHFMYQAMETAKKRIPEIDKEYARRFGFQHGGFMERYKCEDADLILLAMGTMGSEAKKTVDRLRGEGLKVGSARVRVFRPFPKAEIRGLAEDAEMFTVIDRQVSYGMEGPLFTEVKASLYGQEEAPLVRNFIAGLGGRDVTYLDIEKMARRSLKSLEAGRVDDEVEWFGLRK